MKNLREILVKHKVIISVIAVVLTLPLAISAVLFVLVQRDSNISGRDAVITNVTDTAFTVTWVSDHPYVGRIVYQEGSEWRPIFAQQGLDYAWDDRDVELNDDGEYVQVEEGVKERYTHHVTIRNLKPDTVYTFRVGGSINGKELSANTVKTREIIEELNTPDPAYGQMENINPEDAFIVIGDKNDTSETAPLISSPVSQNGTYSVDANFFGRDNIAGDELYAIVRSEDKIISQHDYESEGYKPLDTIIVTDTTVSEQQNNRTKGQSLVIDVNAQGSCEGGISDFLVPEGFDTNDCYYDDPTTSTIENQVDNSQRLSTRPECRATSTGANTANWCLVTENGQAPPIQDTTGGSGSDVEEDNTETPQTDNNTTTPPTTSVSGSFNCDGLGNVVTYRANQGINIRPQPNTSQSSIGGLSSGQTIQGCSETTEGEIVWGDDSDWVKIDNNGEAYIYAQLLTQVDNAVLQVDTDGDTPMIEEEEDLVFSQPVSNREIDTYNISFLNQQCTDSSQCGGRGLVCQCENLRDVGVDRGSGATALGWGNNCNQSQLRCLDRQESGFTYLVNDYMPELNTTWSPDGTYGKFDRYYGNWYGIHPDLISPLNSFFANRNVREYLDTNNQVVLLASGFRPGDNWSQHRSGRAIDLYIVDRGTTGSNSRLREITPLRAYLEGVGFVYPISWDTPHYYYPEKVYLAARDADSTTSTIPGHLIEPIIAQDNDDNIINSSGVYEVESQNLEFYNRQVEIALEDEEFVRVIVFDDEDLDGNFDDSERLVSNTDDIRLNKTKEILSYNFTNGWNLISLPFVSEEIKTADDLMEELFPKLGALHIAKFESGTFEIYSKRKGFDSGDFDLRPGEGYFVFVQSSGIIEISVNVVESKVPTILSNGWNLVGFNGYEALDTDSLLDSANDQNLELTTISQFENGRYDSVVQDDGVRFGNSFNIIDKRGYFIRVESFEDQIFTP